jgi:hypothetical protein
MRRKVKQLVVGETYVDMETPSNSDVLLQYVESNDTSDYFKRISGDSYLENSRGLIGFNKGINWYTPDDDVMKEEDDEDGIIQVGNRITRVEVIGEKGRVYTNWKPTNKVELQIQDGGKTLKIFISQEL